MNRAQTLDGHDMNRVQSLDSQLESVAWGALFVWWGITAAFSFLPDGTGLVGTGLILTGLNAVRWLNGIPTHGFSTLLGIVLIVWGELELEQSILPFDVPVLAITLIVVGATVMARAVVRHD